MISIEANPIVVGRSDECDLVIDGRQICRRHCTIKPANGFYLMEDLGSIELVSSQIEAAKG